MLKVACWLGCGLAVMSVIALAQTGESASALDAMVSTERAFAERARVVGWKQAFLEYFADDALAFSGDTTEPAKVGLREAPDPPKDLQLLWEPRVGDVAASGELGYLTGPSTTINPARNNGAPRHGNYASIWKRQMDGTYKVIIDVGVNLPSAAPFAPGFTRAPGAGRYTGQDTVEAATRSLAETDADLNREARRAQSAAYAGRLADGVRLHRPGQMPVVGTAAAAAWLATQPPSAGGESRFAQVANSRDLGYTWGTYAVDSTGNIQSEKGFYVRVWARSADGTWAVALDVLQPQ